MDSKIDYNATLNLPKTDFPMRAGLPQREPEYIENYYSQELYKKLMEKNKNKPKYILHDGPPYANGDIHVGHALNKVLKDFNVRYKNMTGFQAPLIHGWDTHGLPIEQQAIKKIGLDKMKLSMADFRKQCREFALSYVDNQRNQMKRLGVIGDFDNPYLTLNPNYEATQIEVFGKMVKKGYIYKGLKPVYWCPKDQTALAEAEIEYAENICDSIYVKFKISNDKNLLKKYGENIFFVIWTTTTWTLPGNTAICLGQNFQYAIVKVNNEYLIIARDLVEEVAKIANFENYEIVDEFIGKDFEFMTVQHPFLDRKSIVINGDHVTLESGTGCVHTAPGHGMEDYQVSLKYENIPIIVPVDDKGFMTDEAGKYKGLFYEKSNEIILNDLKSSGALLATQKISHQYPHCWRCKSPVIFRATEQFFCSIDKFRDKAIEECKKINWYPTWGKDRIISMITDRNDWCISRQRIWGVPIPVFYCKDCGKEIVNDTTIKIVADLFRKESSDGWYNHTADEILDNAIKCDCGGQHFEKETDIMDVWFDSGSSNIAVLCERPELQYPADTYLEGVDQFRGWFQSSLLISVALNDIAPYKNVYVHGFTVDAEGKKMSKSSDNSISPIDVVNEYGADILRLWVSSFDYTNDIRVSQDIFKQLSEVYRKIRNTARFILGNINDFNPKLDKIEYKNMAEIDKWALNNLNKLIKNVTESFENCEYHTIFHMIHNFCVVEMSNFYLDIIKDTLYVEKNNSPARRSSQTAIYIILDTLMKLLSPILFFTSDEIWKSMPTENDNERESIMFSDFPVVIDEYTNPELEQEFDKFMEIREIVKKSLEDTRARKEIGASLEAKVIISCKKDLFDFYSKNINKLKSIFIVSDLEIHEDNELTIKVEKATGNKCERCWTYDVSVGQNNDHPTICKRCISIII